MKMPSPWFGIKLMVAFACLKNVLILLAGQVRLRLQPLEPEPPQEGETTNYVLVMSPTPIPVPIETLTSLIKKTLHVSTFGNEDEECTCLVCLESITKTHQVRQLCNCTHVFHKECLDNWVDHGRVTCPLCRSMLFPDNIFTPNKF